MNYTSGSAISFPVSEAGIGPAASFAPQEGLKPLGPNPNRQDGGHAHCLMFSPTSPGDCYVPDLGMDAVWHYKFSAESGELTLSQETSCDSAAPSPFTDPPPPPPPPPTPPPRHPTPPPPTHTPSITNTHHTEKGAPRPDWPPST
eukprot:COSAG04_NODE_4369_length_2134_cov_4.958231_3_plen_145_part_00